MRRLLAAACLVFAPLVVQEASAQDAPVITPPQLTRFVEADYPAEAEAAGREASVMLELTVSADGTVSDVSVVEGAGDGFDEAAQSAVQRFGFEPATRNGEAVPARFRYRYVFELADPEPEPEPVDAPPRSGRLEGTVLSTEGASIVGVEVVLTSADQTLARRALTEAGGVFRFDDLPPGSYEVRLRAEEYGDLVQTEEVRSDEVTGLTYRMAPLDDGGDDDTFSAVAVIDPPPREVTRRTLSRETLTRIPGTRGDALRAIEILPGVARPPFGSGQLVIRGSAPGDSQVFLDGVPLPQLYHFGGLTSVINSRMLERIDFFPGNYSPRYGRKMGGIIEVGTRDPRSDGVHGVAELSVIDVSLLAEFPIGERASGAFSLRRSLIDLVFDNFVPDSVGVTAAPVYYDYQGWITWRPTDRDRVRVLTYGASDRFAVNLEDSLADDPGVRGNLDLTSRFNFLQLGWDRQISRRTELDVDFQSGPIDLEFSLGDLLKFDLRLWQTYGRLEVRHRPTSRVRLIAGADIFVSPFDLTYTGPAIQQSEGDPGGGGSLQSMEIGAPLVVDSIAFRPGFYVESDMRLLKPWQVVLGARLDYASEIDRFAFDPRLVSMVEVYDGVKIKTGVGLYSQPPEFQESVRQLGNPDLEWIHSAHFGGGIDWTPTPGIQIGVEGFYKRLWNRVVSTEGGVPPRFENGGIGRIYGMEVSARIDPTGRRFFGYLSYTLSRSERLDQPDDPDAQWRLFDFDQTHIFTLTGVYRLPRNWEVGGTLRLVSGNPYTPIVGAALDPTYETYIPINGRVNSQRNPLFNRLDIRVEKQWLFDGWKLALFLDIQNVYNRQNQEGLIYNYDYTQSTVITGLPIIPALGFRGEL